ncbi:hypothetical protein CHLRE_12g556150v5 [Chlamydomonas reinhardtii]|uniref:CAAX prenyl protease 2/Lysostaphin resistance protein A-like domain-containing protein n=1 Tax=Chlamydomonas reinhardtii TaxID=3055 RepID=A0A2K3D5T0_CHLRE|nr:uncharacterized protein CHLRE_12g556150v5 [Chlamydomonas reinhardtii]PNW75893.1 hypothetical protein CHLRE_12g556150v5 [Chlamydomonas reinhardtii]
MGPMLLQGRCLGTFTGIGTLRSRRGDALLAHARKQVKKNRKQQQRGPGDEVDELGSDPGMSATRLVLENVELPAAPSPRSRPGRNEAVSPEQIYPVFAPKPGAAQSNAPWRWEDGERDSDREDEGEEASSSGASDVPKWNPRTGFMKTQADIEAEQAAAVEAAAAAAAAAAVTSGAAGAGGLAAATPAPASAAGRPGTSGLRTGSGAAAAVRATSGPVEVSLTAPGPVQQPSAASTSAPAAAPLPPASRNAVLTSALGTGFWMAVIAVFFRNYAALNSAAAMGTDPEAVAALLRWPSGFESFADVAVAAGAAAAVTAARQALLGVWGDLREATDRSNAQILTTLNPFDIVLVALASGIPEELLFRGALIPATFPDWRGAAIAAVIFGALHTSGGRNPAFAVWAAAVGGLYGAAFLVTGNIWVPAVAHVGANAASAFIWKGKKIADMEAAREAQAREAQVAAGKR